MEGNLGRCRNKSDQAGKSILIGRLSEDFGAISGDHSYPVQAAKKLFFFVHVVHQCGPCAISGPRSFHPTHGAQWLAVRC